jgi:hypothetical protein
MPNSGRALLMTVAVALAGCESGQSILGQGNATPETQVTQQAAPQPPKTNQPRVAIAPVIGAPDNVAKQMQSEMASAVERNKVTIVTGAEKIDYTLRGYVVAAKEKTQTKVSYIWDVTDAAGRRVNRIAGEELAPGTPSKDPWASVSPQLSQQIAQKSSTSFASWLAQNPPQPSGPAVASAAPVGVGAAPSAPQSGVTSASATPQPISTAATTQGPQTGSISRADVTAVVPAVTGAPGDGAQSLTGAIQAELSKNGVLVTPGSASPTAYRIEGVVKVGAARDGNQPIQIDWNVKDPQGKKLGTVSQKNEIPEGSLDGAWGRTADAAAAAATQGILKLLPQKTASN